MSGEQNYFPKRERTPKAKRRSSILKRQDTCLITEEGAEGSRTPRRVSFAKKTMIKEFLSNPWSSHDDSSIHSSKSNQSSTSLSREDVHDTTLSEVVQQNVLKGHKDLLLAKKGQPTFQERDELVSQQRRETSAVVQNRTICFQDLDVSGGDMNLTTNITMLSMSVCSREDGGVDPTSVPPCLYKEHHESKEPHHHSESGPGQQVLTSASRVIREHMTMEMNQNIHSTSLEETSENIVCERQLSDDYTEDMELTANLMYSSRAALVDISVNNASSNVPTMSTQSVKPPVSLGTTPAVKSFGLVASEDQENNHSLMLQNVNSANHNSSVMNTSNMEIIEGKASDPVASDGISASKLGSANLISHREGMTQMVAIGSDTIEKRSSEEVSARQNDNASVAGGNKRGRLTDHLTSQILSPVVEMSGLNHSSWLGSQISQSLNVISVDSTPHRYGLANQQNSGCNTSEDHHKNEPKTKTIFFGSPSTTGMDEDAGDLEITNNITCDIQSGPLVQSDSSKQKVSLDQGPVHFDPPGALGNETLQTARDMELTESSCDSHVHTAPPRHGNILHTASSQPRSPQTSADCEPQSKTVYFGSGAMETSGNMEFTEAVPILNRDGADDPEIMFNFSKNNSMPIQEKSLSGTSNDAAAISRDPELSFNGEAVRVNKSGMHISFVKEMVDGITDVVAFQKGEQSIAGSNNSEHLNVSEHSNSTKQSSSEEQNGLCFSNTKPSTTPEQAQLRNNAFDVESVDSPAHQDTNSSSKTDHQIHHASESIQKINKDIGMDESNTKKTNLIRGMGNFLTLTRRSSILLSKNTFNARKSLGGLSQTSQHRDHNNCKDSLSALNSTNSNSLISNLIRGGEDEVDGMIISAGDHSGPKASLFYQNPHDSAAFAQIDNGSSMVASSCKKLNSSEIVSVFTAINSPRGPPLLHHTNSSAVKPMPLESNMPGTAPELRESTAIDASSQGKDSSLSLQSQRISFTTLHTSAGKEVSSQAQLGQNSIAHHISHSEHNLTPEREPSLDDTRDEQEMLDLTDFNVDDLLLKCAVDEEVPEDFLQDLESVMSKADPATPKSQEAASTLPDMYRFIGFDSKPTLGEEELPSPMDVDITSTEGKLQSKLAVVPKIEALQLFIKSMECTIDKLKQENGNKLEVVKEQISGLLTSGKENTKSAALEMCKSCRILSRSKWWQQEADHLIKYFTLREETLAKLNSDVEFFQRETDIFSDLNNEIDECLQKINVIQEVEKGCEPLEMRLSETNIDMSHLKEKSKQLDDRVSSIQETCKELIESTAAAFATQESVKEQFWWLESLKIPSPDEEREVDLGTFVDQEESDIDDESDVNLDLDLDLDSEHNDDDLESDSLLSDSVDRAWSAEEFQWSLTLPEQLIFPSFILSRASNQQYFSKELNLTEWTLLAQRSEDMTFGFLFNTLVLQVCFDDKCDNERGITDVTLRSRLAGASKPWAKLAHNLAISSINCGALKRQHRSWNQLSKLLLDVSTIVCNCRQLSTELREAHLRHRIWIQDSALGLYILDRKKRQKVQLQTHFEAPCGYPNSKINWTVTVLFGDPEPEAIMQATRLVTPGHLYLTRIIKAAEMALCQSKR